MVSIVLINLRGKMSETLIPEIQRFENPETGQGESSFVDPKTIINKFSSAEKSQLFFIQKLVEESDFPRFEKQNRLTNLDSISEDFLPCKISEYPYYFPDQLPYFNEKSDYKKTRDHDIYCDAPFFVLPDGQIFFCHHPEKGKYQIVAGECEFTDPEKRFKQPDLTKNESVILNLENLPIAIQPLPDGKVVIAGKIGDKFRIECLSKGSGDEWDEEFIGDYPDKLYGLRALPDGRILAVGRNGIVSFKQEKQDKWTMEEVFKKYFSKINNIPLLPDGGIVSVLGQPLADFDPRWESIRVGVLREGENGDWTREVVARFPEENSNCIIGTEAMPDGRILFRLDDYIYIFERKDNGDWDKKEIGVPGIKLRNFQVLPDSSFMYGDLDDDIVLWSEDEQGNWESRKLFKSGTGITIHNIQAMPDGKIYAFYQSNLAPQSYYIALVEGEDVSKEENA